MIYRLEVLELAPKKERTDAMRTEYNAIAELLKLQQDPELKITAKALVEYLDNYKLNTTPSKTFFALKKLFSPINARIVELVDVKSRNIDDVMLCTLCKYFKQEVGYEKTSKAVNAKLDKFKSNNVNLLTRRITLKTQISHLATASKATVKKAEERFEPKARSR